MEWTGWMVALVALGVAGWLARRLASERTHAMQLLYARIDAENQAGALRENQSRVLRSARRLALGRLLDAAAARLHGAQGDLRAQLDAARAEFDDYRERVRRYDAAVQYCLQPVELIFGADKASLDQLVQHVEGARRGLFEARSALEKSPLHRGDGPLQEIEEAFRPLAQLDRGLAGFAGASEAARDVRASLDGVLAALAPSCTVVREDQPVPPLEGARGAVPEILLHLLDNAIQAAGPGGRVVAGVRPAGPNAIEIAIADDGPGIAEEALEHVFEPFFTTRPDEAAGLGLALARELAAQEGGAIAVRSTRGHGATFTLTLPVRLAVPAAPPEPAPAGVASAPAWATAR